MNYDFISHFNHKSCFFQPFLFIIRVMRDFIMKMNEKIRTILITVAATLTVELFIFVILGSMGVTTVNFGGNATSANKDGNNTVTAEINDDVRKSSTSAASTTTVSTTASSTSAAKSTAATGKTTKGNNKNTQRGNNCYKSVV